MPNHRTILHEFDQRRAAGNLDVARFSYCATDDNPCATLDDVRKLIRSNQFDEKTMVQAIRDTAPKQSPPPPKKEKANAGTSKKTTRKS